MSHSPLPLRQCATEVSQEQASEACGRCFLDSLETAHREDEPFVHWSLRGALPASAVAALCQLPMPVADLGSLSGSRELHNQTRCYLDADAVARDGVSRSFAETFQSPVTAAAIQARTGARLAGTYLRIEYAQDTDGFWLKPHTDLGVKAFTLLVGLAPEGRPDLGTDLYADPARWSVRATFRPGDGLAFVPSDRTWHGFEPRRIGAVRKSLIVNYVTDEWRAREQLAFPDRPVQLS
ncbi:hypothetical protein [Phenylobacterium hankyongense]|uniref:hypothetical protein n=1 Tax=Phenylobacterium hankyongense TaxID=1813876 RepID=UPI001A9E34C1|nr:hypothetical protein [Phenylobacterium hankyongense]